MRIGGALDLNRKLHNEPTQDRGARVLAVAGWRTVAVAIILTAVLLRLGGPFEPSQCPVPTGVRSLARPQTKARRQRRWQDPPGSL